MKNLDIIRERYGASGLIRVLANDAVHLGNTAGLIANRYDTRPGYEPTASDLENLNQAIAMIDRDLLLVGHLVELLHKSEEQLLIDQSVSAWAGRIRKECGNHDSE